MKKLLIVLLLPRKIRTIKKLLRIYEEAIRHINNMNTKECIKEYLYYHCLVDGVCACAQFYLKTDIYDESWVSRHGRDDGYWVPTPRNYTLIKDNSTYRELIINTLRMRTNILREELEHF